MSQRFTKGRTNNHLTWVMVDSTDFASPESALSAATKIKIYGKVRGATGVNFVSSGTGSLTNDIQHVGASALGIYTIALAKADLSDASAAWYDQYIISLSATGAAYQTLVVDGGIDASALSAMQSRLSDIQSYLVALSGLVSDVHSAAILGASHASDAFSVALLVQSRLSDLDSRLASNLSDALSGITALSDAVSNAHSAATLGASRILVVQSRLSDLDSRLVSDLSDVLSAATAGASRALINQSRISDVQSYLVAISDALSNAHSDLRSQISGITATLSASDISDIASAVRATLDSDLSDLLSRTTQINSRVLVVQSLASDAHSAAILGASHASDAHSAILLVQSRLSDLDSRLVSDVSDLKSLLSDVHSDLKSALGDVSVTITASDISDIASAVVAALPITSMVSDIYSLLSDLNSNFLSRVPKETAARSQLSDLVSDAVSDLRSFIGAGVPADASTLSDLRSAIAATELDASDLSDIASRVATVLASDLSDILSAAQQANSRVLLNQSRVSDIASVLSNLDSNFNSRVPKEVAARSQLSDLVSDAVSDLKSFVGAGVPLDASSLSDLRSAIAAINFDASDLASQVVGALASDLSDIHSAATAGSSRALVNQSRISDVYSLLSDLHSDVAVVSGVVSDVYSVLVAGVPVDGSTMSDLRSAITANGVLRAGADPTTVVGVTDTLAAKVDWITALSRNKVTQTATVQSLRNDADGADIASAAVSDDGTTFTRGEFS